MDSVFPLPIQEERRGNLPGGGTLADVKGRQVVTLNGAEFLELEARAREVGLSVPQFIRMRCGLTARGIVAVGNVAPEDPCRARRPVLALERRNVTIVLDDAEREHLKAQAHEAGTTLPQHIRTLCDLAVRNTSLPGTEERDLEEEDAWERLKRLGLNPREYFPAEA